MVQGGDVPFPKTTIERLPKPKEELWKQQMGLRDPKWSTTTRTTIGAFYKQGIWHVWNSIYERSARDEMFNSQNNPDQKFSELLLQNWKSFPF